MAQNPQETKRKRIQSMYVEKRLERKRVKSSTEIGRQEIRKKAGGREVLGLREQEVKGIFLISKPIFSP